MKGSEQSLRNLWGTIKYNNILIMGVPEKEKERKRQKEYMKK